MKVEQLMTRKLITVPSDTKLGRAALEMKLAEVRHLPVVNRAQRLVGIISRRDLARVARYGDNDELAVDDIMRSTVHTVRPDSDAATAAALLIEKKIGALPVVDHEGTLVGIITEVDFLNVAYQALSGLPLHARGKAS